MTTLQVAIRGISCLADPRNGHDDPFMKRVLLPTDTIFDATHPPHIPYVEVVESDLFNDPSTIPGLSGRYYRKNIAYRRFELYGHRVRLEHIDTGQGWWVSTLYDFRVPKMKQVAPSLYDNPADFCFHQDPPANLVSGYFDMTYGRLTVGEIDGKYTSFNPLRQWPRRRLAIVAVLEVAVTDAVPTFWIESVGLPPGTSGTPVRLQPDTSGISIGNLPLSDLTAQPSTDDPAHDFLMFYQLADPPATEKPVPTRGAGLEIACTPTGWP